MRLSKNILWVNLVVDQVFCACRQQHGLASNSLYKDPTCCKILSKHPRKFLTYFWRRGNGALVQATAEKQNGSQVRLIFILMLQTMIGSAKARFDFYSSLLQSYRTWMTFLSVFKLTLLIICLFRTCCTLHWYVKCGVMTTQGEHSCMELMWAVGRRRWGKVVMYWLILRETETLHVRMLQTHNYF